MGIQIRSAEIPDYGFVKSAFDRAHKLHLRLTKEMGLDVYRDSVVNIKKAEYIFLAFIQRLPDTIGKWFLERLGQEPFLLEIAKKDARPVGALYAIQSPEEPEIVILDNIVAEGMGRDRAISLVKEFQVWASERGYQTLRAEILCNNKWSSNLAEKLGAKPARIILAKNIEPAAAQKAQNTQTDFEGQFLTTSIKPLSNRSWYKHKTLKLAFNGAATSADTAALLKEVQSAVDFGSKQGCGLVEAELLLSQESEGLIGALKEQASFQGFKFLYEQNLGRG